MAKKEQKQAEKVAAKNKQSSESKVSKLKKSRADLCVAEIQEALGKVSSTYYDLSRLCHEANEGKYWAELKYDKPEHFSLDKFSMKYRKFKYFSEIGEAIDRFGIKPAQLSKIEWSKMAAIAGILTEENFEEWLDEAGKLSYTDLVEKVKIVKGRTSGKKDGEVVTKMSLTLGEDKAVYIENAIKAACDTLETDNRGEALVHICVEWLEKSGVSSEGIPLDAHIAYLEGRFPVKISYVETEEDLDADDPEEDVEDPGEDIEFTDDIEEDVTEETEALDEDDELGFLDDEEAAEPVEDEPIEEVKPKKEKKPKTEKKPKVEKKEKKPKKTKPIEEDDDLDL